jgi:hypothetical protein
MEVYQTGRAPDHERFFSSIEWRSSGKKERGQITAMIGVEMAEEQPV